MFGFRGSLATERPEDAVGSGEAPRMLLWERSHSNPLSQDVLARRENLNSPQPHRKKKPVLVSRRTFPVIWPVVGATVPVAVGRQARVLDRPAPLRGRPLPCSSCKLGQARMEERLHVAEG